MCEHAFVTVTDERLDVQLSDVRALEAPVRAVVEALDPDAVFIFDAPACSRRSMFSSAWASRGRR
jgi:hypothetical protein